MKKQTMAMFGILAGIVFLAGGGYAAGKFLGKKKSAGNYVRLEDGRKMKLENQNDFQNQNRPDLMGRIKSVGGDSIVVEKFAMPAGRPEGGAVSADERQQAIAQRQQGEQARQETDEGTPEQGRRMGMNNGQLQVEGEKTISLAQNVEVLKNSRAPQEGSVRSQNAASELDKISISDLKEGDMISVWFAEGEENIAQRIMVRSFGVN